MTEEQNPATSTPTPGPTYGDAQPPVPAYEAAPPATPQTTGINPYGAMPPGAGTPGQIRSTGMCILLSIVTFGIYSLYWYYQTHEEMKLHTGQGIGGVLALVLALFVGIAMPFVSSNEVGALYTRTGRPAPVSSMTGLWYFPGIFILVGPLVWFIKTNGALNEYWKSQGVVG